MFWSLSYLRFCHDHPIYLLYFGLLRSYIASVIKFCEKPGNERLIKNLAVTLGMLWVKLDKMDRPHMMK